jgi:hypothetical protein
MLVIKVDSFVTSLLLLRLFAPAQNISQNSTILIPVSRALSSRVWWAEWLCSPRRPSSLSHVAPRSALQMLVTVSRYQKVATNPTRRHPVFQPSTPRRVGSASNSAAYEGLVVSGPHVWPNEYKRSFARPTSEDTISVNMERGSTN